MTMRKKQQAVTLAASLILGAGALAMDVNAASAQPRHHGTHAASAGHSKAGVRFEPPMQEGRSALVSDGPGTGFGFHRLPREYRIGAAIHRDRQNFALHQAVESDALTSGGYRSGFLGDDVAGSVPYSNYGVFSGADGYGSPFFAGYYGPGGGEDLGPLGHTYE